MEAADDDLAVLGGMLKARDVTVDKSLSARDLDFIRAWRVYMTSQSESSHKAILRFVGHVASPHIAAFYAEETDVDVASQKRAAANALTIVKKITGRAATRLTVEESKQARVRQPALYTEYMAARRVINQITKDAWIDVVRANGGPMIVSDVAAALDRLGVEHNLPVQFRGKMDERGWYTMFDEQIDGAPVGEVKMNPAYTKGGSVYVFQNRADGAKNWQTIYTKAAKATRKEAKYSKVASAYDNLEKYQRVWRGDLMGQNTERQELGVIVELFYLTASRIGSPGNEADGKKTYGLSTILGAHVSKAGTGIRIKYPGKKGALIDNVVQATDKYSRRVIELVKQWAADAGTKGRVFKADARDINVYIKTRVKLPITAHGFRYLRGTNMMIEELEKQRSVIGKDPSERDIAGAFKTASETVGALLGHTTKSAEGVSKIVGSTAVKSYIDPSVSRSWFEGYGVRPPRNVESL